MERRAVGVVEPVAWIEWEQFDLGTFRQVTGLIHHQSTGPDPSLDRHIEPSLALGVPANKRLAPRPFRRRLSCRTSAPRRTGDGAAMHDVNQA